MGAADFGHLLDTEVLAARRAVLVACAARPAIPTSQISSRYGLFL